MVKGNFRLYIGITLFTIVSFGTKTVVFGIDHFVDYNDEDTDGNYTKKLIPHYPWSCGCAPTAVATALGYWDNYGPIGDGDWGKYTSYGKLIEYYIDKDTLESYKGSDGINYDWAYDSYMAARPQLIVDLAEEMETTGGGSTTIGNQASGTNEVTNERGYGNWANLDILLLWSTLKSEIDNNQPCKWGVTGHALCAWGYSDDELVFVYDSNISNYPYRRDCDKDLCTNIVKIHPKNGNSGQDVLLITPHAGKSWIGGTTENIEWKQYGTDINNVDISYSTNGGKDWSIIETGVTSTSGSNSYPWTIPNDIGPSSRMRIAIRGKQGITYLSSDGSTGNFTITPDNDPPNSEFIQPSAGSTQGSTSFTVSWDASASEAGESGVKWYEIQYKDGAGGTWTNLPGLSLPTTQTSKTFNGTNSHTYYFQCKAQDNAGNWETYPGGSGDTWTTVNTAAGKILVVSQDNMNFSGQQGGSNPEAQAINISNGGSGTMSWTASDDQTWLSISPDNGTAPSNPSVSIDISKASLGTNEGTITITGSGAADSPQYVSVSLTITSGSGDLEEFIFTNSNILQDAYANGSAPDTPYGTGDVMRVETNGGLTEPNGEMRGYLKFNLSSISGRTVYSAKLKLYCSVADGSLIDSYPKVNADRITSNWTESGVTWNNMPNYTTTGKAYTNVTTTGWKEWNVKTIVSEWINNGTSNYGFGIFPAVINGTARRWFRTREYSSNRPQLEVEVLYGTPDLICSVPWITDTSDNPISPPFTVGQSVKFYGKVINNGPGGAPNSHIGWYLRSSDTDFSGDPEEDCLTSILLAGEDDEDDRSYTFLVGDVGTRYLNSKADWEGEVNEGSNEGNNTKSYGPFEVNSQPVLQVSPASLSFDGKEGDNNPSAKPFEITEGGGGNLEWTGSSNKGWLTISPNSGVTLSVPAISVDISDMKAISNPYSGTITITASGASGSPKNIPVTVNIAPCLLQPNGGETLQAGDNYKIKWSTSGGIGTDHVKLSYSTDGGSTYPNTITASTPDNGIYPWTVVDIETTTVKVKVVWENSSNVTVAEDASESNLTILYPPAQITNLSAITGDNAGEINLSWTATGEDGDNGQALSYILKYSTNDITNDTEFNNADTYFQSWAPKLSGQTETYTLEGLESGTTYFIAIKAVDDLGNKSELSNVPSAWAQIDTISPNDISDLSASSGINDGEIILNWTAPGNDDTTGTADHYWIKYAETEIADGNDWDSATTWKDNLAVGGAYGISESETITGLTPLTTYYFAIKTADSKPNWSGLSNSPSTKAKLNPPTAPTNFSYSTKTVSSIRWVWNDIADSEDGYKIYTSTDGLIATLLADATYYLETNRSPNELCSRYCVAYNVSGEGVSNSSSCYTLANPPTGLEISERKAASITLIWNAGEGGNTRYAVEKATDGVNFSYIIQWADGLTANTTTDTGLNSKTTYYYRVRGYNGDSLETDFDTIISTITLPPPPTLSWTEETNYTSDGLHPESGSLTTEFVFQVKYTDSENRPIADGYPKVHIGESGVALALSVEISSSPFTMEEVDHSDTTYTDGKVYSFSISGLSPTSGGAYYFEAQNIIGQSAAGEATAIKSGPKISPPPTVSITSPDNGDTVSGTVYIKTYASDDEQIYYQKLYFSGQGSAYWNPVYNYNYVNWHIDTRRGDWNWQNKWIPYYPDGWYEIKAYAYDNLNQYSTDTIKVLLFNSSGWDWVHIENPSENDIVSGIINIDITTDYDTAINKIEIFIDNEKKYTNNSSSVTWAWDTREYLNGTHQIKVIGRDTGNYYYPIKDVRECSVEVSNKIDLILPKNNVKVSGDAILIKGDGNKPANIEFFQVQYKKSGDDTPWIVLGSSLTIAPFVKWWDTTDLENDAIYEVRILMKDYDNNITYIPESFIQVYIDNNNPEIIEKTVNLSESNVITKSDAFEISIPQDVLTNNTKVISIKNKSGIETSDRQLYTKIDDANLDLDNFNLELVPGNSSMIDIKTMEDSANVISQNFSESVIMTISYSDEDGDKVVDGTDISALTLKMYRLDESTNCWVEVNDGGINKVDWRNKVVKAEIKHFSVYAIIGQSSKSSDNLNNVIVYPNPKKLDSYDEYVKFINLTDSAELEIFTITGELVRKFTENDLGALSSYGPYFGIKWDCKNNSGNDVASGIYIYLIEDDSGQKVKGKFSIIR